MTDADQELLSEDDVKAHELEGFSVVDGKLEATFATNGFVAGLRLVNAVGQAAEEANHHPDILLTWPEVVITLVSHDVGGLTLRDVRVARRINEIAAAQGIPHDA